MKEQITSRVSVVMPVFNREKYVANAVKTILNQPFTDFEFIIIDDGSTDHTILPNKQVLRIKHFLKKIKYQEPRPFL